jgi:hypothetical protein
MKGIRLTADTTNGYTIEDYVSKHRINLSILVQIVKELTRN